MPPEDAERDRRATDAEDRRRRAALWQVSALERDRGSLFAGKAPPTVTAPTTIRVGHGNRRPRRRIGWKIAWAARSTRVSLSFTRRDRPSEASTGMSVSDMTIEPSRAKTTVSAIGRKSFPSIPWRVRIGR